MRDEDNEKEIELRTIRPHIPKRVMGKLTAFIETKLDECVPSISASLRKLSDAWKNEAWALELRATALVVADLLDQGWAVRPDHDSIHLLPPGARRDGETVGEAKHRLRQSLRMGRDRQISDPSVHKFLTRFSGKALNNRRKTSALDVVDDGANLAKLLAEAAKLPREEALAQLRTIIEPVVEACDDTARCPETGIRLLDLWRYFRHTWSLEYRSIPGRQVPLLIRNAARPGRPLIGIALLASPVLRTKPRDSWLGWTPEPFIARLRSGEWNAKKALKALAARIEESIAEIRWDDLAQPEEIENPTERIVFRLEQRGAGAAAARESQLQAAYAEALEEHGRARSQKDPTKRGTNGIDWLTASEDLLFIRKRADTLARLLNAKRVFCSLDWKLSGRELLDAVLTTAGGERALSAALVEVRKAGLASQIADLSVCGAVAPYNVLLGGKLVALAMASEDVRNLWKDRYENKISIISSQMAGRPVSRRADLKVMTTTSLYGGGSSQYNRLRLRAADHPELKGDIEWKELAKTAGFGTVHLSASTVKILRKVTEQEFKARRVNNRFGEGTSPRLRQVREGLDVLGIESDDVLHHATPRLFYACSLVPNAAEQLLGLTVEKNGHATPLSAVAETWRSRWLLQRIGHLEVMEKLKSLGPKTIREELISTDLEGQYSFKFEE